jgi:hypothetical protein
MLCTRSVGVGALTNHYVSRCSRQYVMRSLSASQHLQSVFCPSTASCRPPVRCRNVVNKCTKTARKGVYAHRQHRAHANILRWSERRASLRQYVMDRRRAGTRFHARQRLNEKQNGTGGDKSSKRPFCTLADTAVDYKKVAGLSGRRTCSAP